MTKPSGSNARGDVFLLPSRDIERSSLEERAESELELTLSELSGVSHCRTHVTWARPATLAGAPATQARASIVLHGSVRDEPAVVDQVRTVVRGTVPQLADDGLSVVFVPASTPAPTRTEAPRLVHVGPITVTEETAPALRWVLGGYVLATALLAGVLLVRIARRRRFLAAR